MRKKQGNTRAVNKKVTLRDVADLASVCKSTASRILRATNGDPLPFDPKTQEIVRAAAAKLSYSPSRLARSLTTSKTHAVGFIVPSVEDSFFPNLTAVIETRLAECDYSVTLATTRDLAAIECVKIVDLLGWHVDGLIIVPCQETMDPSQFWSLWHSKTPFVLLDRLFPDTPFHSVTTDDYAGAALAVEHLLSIGRTRIARVGGPLTVYTNRLRDRGWTETLLRAGIIPEPSYAIDVPTTLEGGRQAVRMLVECNLRPDALFCLSDRVAAGAIEECHRLGIRIPDEMALVGYADLELSFMLRIPLTTVRQPRREVGLAAANRLLSLINGETPETAAQVFPVELVVRESTVACR